MDDVQWEVYAKNKLAQTMRGYTEEFLLNCKSEGDVTLEDVLRRLNHLKLETSPEV